MSAPSYDDPTKPRVFNNPTLARVMAAQFYVIKELDRNPTKALRFMQDNKDYFPNYDNTITSVMKQHNITQDDIDAENEVKLADLHTEQKRREEVKKDSVKIHSMRREDHKKRNFGHGIKPLDEPDNGPENVYSGESAVEETNKVFAKLSVNLKEKEFRPKEVFN